MVASEHDLYQTTVQLDKTLVFYSENFQQEVYITTFFATAPLVGILFELC